MKINEGRLQTGEHILARIIQNEMKDTKVVIAKFDKDGGSVEFSSNSDLRELGVKKIERKVNDVIKKELNVNIKIYDRTEVMNKFDLNKIPDSLREIRIVEIQNFDERPCKDPHVNNTKEIGHFIIKKLKRVGKDRYRFNFTIE